MSWFENLKALKTQSGKRSAEIAQGTGLPERTVIRIFNGETDNPSISTLIPIVHYLGGSLDEIFADTKAVVGNKTLATLQARVDELVRECDAVIAERDLLLAENEILKKKVDALSAETELLKTQLLHKEELLAVHSFYMAKMKQ